MVSQIKYKRDRRRKNKNTGTLHFLLFNLPSLGTIGIKLFEHHAPEPRVEFPCVNVLDIK